MLSESLLALLAVALFGLGLFSLRRR
jgi:hypothetical protein